MPTFPSVLARSTALVFWLTGTVMAQNEPLPPLLEGRVAWQHTVRPGEKRIKPLHLIALADRDGGVFVASLVDAPALPSGAVPSLPVVTRLDSSGHAVWSQQLAATFHGYQHAYLSGSVAPDGSLWLAVPYPMQADAPVVAVRIGAADGRILQQRSLPFPRDPNAVPAHAGTPTHVLSLATGSVLALVNASADGWWLSWRDADGGGWDLRLDKPVRFAGLGGWLVNSDGSVSMIARNYPDQWIVRISRDGKAGPWQRVPSTMMTPLLTGSGVAYLEPEHKDSQSRVLKTLDLATNRTSTLRPSIPPSTVSMNFGPFFLTGMTSDGAFVMRVPWQMRGAPRPEDYREATLVSGDGQKMWRIPLRMWDKVIDSRSVLRIDSAGDAWRECLGAQCPGWNISLISYSP